MSVSTARLVRAKYDAAAPGDTLGIANMGPARPSPAGATSSGHSPANFDRNTQQPASAQRSQGQGQEARLQFAMVGILQRICRVLLHPLGLVLMHCVCLQIC